MATPIEELRKQGQSLWLDNIRRQLITSGELAKLRDEGVSGVTSNPTIFEKAVSGSTDYDEALVRLTAAGRKPEEMLWDLMLEDIQAAADVFRPVYDSTGGGDGFRVYRHRLVPPNDAGLCLGQLAIAIHQALGV